MITFLKFDHHGVKTYINLSEITLAKLDSNFENINGVKVWIGLSHFFFAGDSEEYNLVTNFLNLNSIPASIFK